MGQDCFQQGKRGSCVVAEVKFRPQHGLAGFNEGGKVEHAVEGLALGLGGFEKAFKHGPVRQLSFDKCHPCRQQIAPAVTQVVKNDCLVPLFDE
jgi:hypothetical protein